MLLSFLTIVTVLTIAAFSSNIVRLEQKENSSTASHPSVETKVVRDAFGDVEIPVHPQRVVVLDESGILDPVLALGIKPVGIMSCYGCHEKNRGIPNNLIAGIPDVGIAWQPSLERILYLKPDLILSYDFHKKAYSQLSMIAPTVAADFLAIGGFKDWLHFYANVFGKRKLADQLLSHYEERMQELRQQIETKLRTKTISVIVPDASGNSFTIFNPNDVFPHLQMLRDAGLEFVQAQQDIEGRSLTLSIESLPNYDTDFLFIVVSVRPGEAENLLSLSFLEQPIWSTLKAVQNRQVYAVEWDVAGLIGADRVIDDLYKYIVNTP
ncbi:MAG: iron-siderophore ABC transporter substrate-binding protein [Leptolyngbyaceae cyanobacterium RM2_2_4]|nr:iron-siderophore ABC transporter substrate-binding protein [Leptolyngbyaceae cyanobacterium RM2_2_4]